MLSFLSIKSLNCLSLSASLTLKFITCFAVWAAILPKSKEGKGCNTSSPIFLSLFELFKLTASSSLISVLEFSGFSTINSFLKISISPFSLFIKTLISFSWPNFDLAAFAESYVVPARLPGWSPAKRGLPHVQSSAPHWQKGEYPGALPRWADAGKNEQANDCLDPSLGEPWCSDACPIAGKPLSS